MNGGSAERFTGKKLPSGRPHANLLFYATICERGGILLAERLQLVRFATLFKRTVIGQPQLKLAHFAHTGTMSGITVHRNYIGFSQSSHIR